MICMELLNIEKTGIVQCTVAQIPWRSNLTLLKKIYENALNGELNFNKPMVEINRIVNGI